MRCAPMPAACSPTRSRTWRITIRDGSGMASGSSISRSAGSVETTWIPRAWRSHSMTSWTIASEEKVAMPGTSTASTPPAAITPSKLR